MSPLLETKLHRPPLPPRRVHRPRLVRKLEGGRAAGRPIALVSAPAGAGKTTAVLEWLERQDRPVAWLSLDPTDDEPGRFLTYLVAALQRIDPALCRELEGLLRAGQLPPTEVVVATLVRDVLALQVRFVLVLDDLQVVRDPAVTGLLAQLAAHPPAGLELVLLTREDPPLPLALLRANNRLTEVRDADLRFRADEAGAFLEGVLDLTLSAGDVAALADRTEGWVVGLQLAGLSLLDREDPSRFIEALSGSHRFILGYLTEEVLARLSEPLQEFLLRTSILAELHGELCDAVTGRADGAATLEQLLRANLFLIPLDDEGRWYRYHHLFADLLRERRAALLDEQQTRSLHRRASAWYAAADLPGDAIRHALAAEDHEGAVALIEAHAMGMVMQWYARTVTGWMELIPPEWAARSPRTNFAFAWMHLSHGNFAAALPYLQQLQQMDADGLFTEDDPALLAQWLNMQVMMLNAQGQADEALALARRALGIVPPEDHLIRCYLYGGLATAHEQREEYAAAEQAYRRIIEHGRAANHVVSELLGITSLALLGLAQGRLHMVHEVALAGLDRLEQSGELSPIGAAVHGEIAGAYYQWQQLDEAHRHLQRAVDISNLAGYSDADIYYRVIRTRMLRIAGDVAAARREIDGTLEAMRADAPARVREQAIAERVRVLLAEDRPADAEAVLREEGFERDGRFAIPDLPADRPVTTSEAELHDAALRIGIHRARTRGQRDVLRRAMEVVDQLVAEALRLRFVAIALRSLLLRAQMHAAVGDERACLADCAHALRLGEPEGYLTVFAEEGPEIAAALETLRRRGVPEGIADEYVGRVLAACARMAEPGALPAPPEPPAAAGEAVAWSPVEALSEREREVLQAMAEGLKYKEIAARLFVSLNTVRSHVKSIYGKLDVDNRTRALEVARRHGLI